MGIRAAAVVVILGSLTGCPHQDEDPIIDAPLTCEPVDDQNPCTLDECDGPTPIHTPRTGASCTGGTCTAQGTCSGDTCGDGDITGAEQCDDQNTTPADGCSPLCRTEPSEREPNDDGTPAEGMGSVDPGGNDFDATAVANANAQAAQLPLDVAGGALLSVLAAMTPAGDEDVFAVTNSGAAPRAVKFDVWLRLATFGYGRSCGITMDASLTIRDAAGAILAQNDDRNPSNDRCPGLTYTIGAGQTVYAQVVEYGDNTPVNSYAITFEPM